MNQIHPATQVINKLSIKATSPGTWGDCWLVLQLASNLPAIDDQVFLTPVDHCLELLKRAGVPDCISFRRLEKMLSAVKQRYIREQDLRTRNQGRHGS